MIIVLIYYQHERMNLLYFNEFSKHVRIVQFLTFLNNRVMDLIYPPSNYPRALDTLNYNRPLFVLEVTKVVKKYSEWTVNHV